MVITKIVGWVLLSVGVGIIFWTLYTSYNFFTAKTVLPKFFKIEAKENNLNTSKWKTPITPEEIQKQVEEMISQQLKEILPSDTLSNFLNLFVWSILAGILIFGGSQIATLGIKLIK